MNKKILLTIVFWLLTSLSFLIVNASTQKEIETANFLASEWIIKDNSIAPNGYRLWDTITRKETMKIVMKLSWLEITNECKWFFSDVMEDWGCKYIESALKVWFIAKNNKFRPNDNITKTESMKLVLKAKWIKKIQNTTNWQNDYMETAYKYGIIEKKYYDYNADAKRWWIFTITTATIKKEKEIKQKQKKQIYSDEAL